MNIASFFSNAVQVIFAPISFQVSETICLLEEQPESFTLTLEPRSGQVVIILKTTDGALAVLLSPDNLWIDDWYRTMPPLNRREKTRLLAAVRNWLDLQP